MSTRSEKEKMLAGECYNFFAHDLVQEREYAKRLTRSFNTAVDEEERSSILKKLLGKVGHDSLIEPPFYCTYGRNTFLGDHVFFNFSCIILDNNSVHIGNHVLLGPAVQLYTAIHPLDAEKRIQGFETTKGIVIEDKVWIGGGAIVLPGVRISANAVIGAGSVVTRDVVAGTVVAGNPAKVIRSAGE